MRFIFRTVRWIVNLAFLGLLLVGALTFVASRRWGLDFRSVASGSMEPTIPVGSVVAVQPVDPATLRFGYIITFKSPENPNLIVTHQVNEVTGPPEARLFHTKGDANDDPDLELVPASHVLGRVRFHVPYLGYLAQFIRTRQGWLYLVAVPAVLVIVMELINILKVIWTSDEQPPKDSEAAQEPVRGGLPILMTAKRQRKGRKKPMFARKSLPVGALFMVLVIALASLGVGYGLWSKTLTINAEVNTGTLDVDFTEAISNDNAVVDNTSKDNDDDGDDPSGPGDHNKTPRHGKNAAVCYVELDSEFGVPEEPETSLRVKIDGGYPSYYCTIWFDIHNTGSVPVKLKSILLTRPNQPDIEIEPSEWNKVDIDGDGENDIEVHISELQMGVQVDPSETVQGNLDVHILETAPEGHDGHGFEPGETPDFDVHFEYVQWNAP